MNVVVEGRNISKEFEAGAGWSTVGSKKPAAERPVTTNIAAHPATGGREQHQQKLKQQLIKASRMPYLPKGDFKVIIRPKGGLKIGELGAARVASQKKTMGKKTARTRIPCFGGYEGRSWTPFPGEQAPFTLEISRQDQKVQMTEPYTRTCPTQTQEPHAWTSATTLSLQGRRPVTRKGDRQQGELGRRGQRFVAPRRI
ncbi:hypothetical protein HPB50_023961 [Hyalomma asiaticum]|uniref:Uncharacterized protein n=1 Tax=Hyalomma asiaticum TaxID=266040 RepID=A0ACB7S1U2_HYAAI|nr:hypothetical protein HPB50_023961 [Hyalomma asiaticum]